MKAQPKTEEQIAYDKMIAIAAASLAEDEFWCIMHPSGKALTDTRSKDLAQPVRVICGAFDCDWDDLVEQGYRLSRVVLKS